MFGKKAAHLLPDASRTAMLFSKIEQNNKLLTRFGYRSHLPCFDVQLLKSGTRDHPSVAASVALATSSGNSVIVGIAGMKPARIIVLVLAVVAGGIAALLAGRSEPPPPDRRPSRNSNPPTSWLPAAISASAIRCRRSTCAGRHGPPPERASSVIANGPTPFAISQDRSHALRSPRQIPSVNPS